MVKGERVAELIDADITGPRAWMAVTYVPGPTLAQHVEREGPLRSDMLSGLAVGLADALRAIHSVGVVHRDLKPANVILTQAQPVVIDFGVASAANAATLTATGAFVGTPGWIAPEAMLGTTGPDPQQDVWAWGATVLYAATGCAPHGDGPVAALHWRAANLEPDRGLIEQVPQPLRSIVAQALETDPGARPPAASLLGRVLDTLGAPSVAPSTIIADTWAARSRGLPAEPERTPRPRWPKVAAAMSALAALIVLGWFVARLGQGSDDEGAAATPATTATTAPTTAAPTTATPTTAAPTTAAPTTAAPTTASTTPSTVAAPDPSPLGQRPVLRVGEASGSGCTPGAGALPDGWWFGFPASPVGNGRTFGFDLACFNLDGSDPVGSSTVTNDNETLRQVPLAQQASLVCLVEGARGVTEGPCTTTSPGGGSWPGIWVRIEGGEATRVLEQYEP
jgi:serine/threonine protein kinase